MQIMIRALLAAATIASIGNSQASDKQVQTAPVEMVENGFVLEVQYSAERNEYMSPSTSITKIRGFRERKTCWDNAAAIAKAIREAAKNANNIGRESFSCNPDTDFKRLSGEVSKPTKENRDRKAEALAKLLSNEVGEKIKPNFSLKRADQ